MNDRKEKQRTVANVKEDQESELEEDEEITTTGFVGAEPIDLGSDSAHEMKITTLGIVESGLIDLGSDSGNETKISTYAVSKVRREPKIAWLQ